MKELATAFVKVQSQLHNISKDAEGYGYSYLTLSKMISETRGPLAECGLVVLQPLAEIAGQPAVRTVLMHESGQSIEGIQPISAVTMKQCNSAQELGAAITYARRYGYASILSLAQVDDDAQSLGTGNKSQQQTTNADNQIRF